MNKVRIGLIGFGAWVRRAYLPALQFDGRAIITAVTAATEKTRQYATGLLGNQVAVFGSYEALLNYEELDAVMIAVSNPIHQEAITAALKKNLPLFYEPPVSDRRDQIPDVTDSLLSSPKVNFAHLELGFHPGVAYAAELIRRGTVGLLHHVTISLLTDWGNTLDSDLCLTNISSCWYVDVLNRIIGAVPSRVLVLDGYGSPGRMQKVGTGVYDYNGVWGFFKYNLNSPEGLSIVVEISGDSGDIYFNYFTGELRYRNMQHREWTAEYRCPLKPYADWPAVREAVSCFLDAVLSKDPRRGNAQAVAQLNMIGLASEHSKDMKGWADIGYIE